MRYFGVGITDKGIKKKKNQDCICLMISDISNLEQAVMAVVCDGIGGLQQGEVASAAAINCFADWYRTVLPQITSVLSEDLLRSEWTKLITDLNCKILNYGKDQGISLGTTLTALLIINDEYMVAQAGDSRAYCFDKGILQITEDHTYFNRELQSGRSEVASLIRNPKRNRLTESIGVSETVNPDFYFGQMDSEQRIWMLCSDGLRHKITSGEFEERIVPEHLTEKRDLENLANELVDTVKARGETDNISVVLIKACNGVTN